jgi:LPXTG-motif cell wall-anchored protein
MVPAGETKNYNEPFTIASIGTLAKPNSVFLGWNTAANGSGTNYLPGYIITDLLNNTMLYAQWNTLIEPDPIETYTVSYHPNGGTGTAPMDTNRYYPGDKVTLASGTGLTKPGAVFMGWALGNGTAVTSPYTMGYSNVTLFAVWGTAQDLPEVPKTGDGASAFGLVMLFAGLAAAAFVLLKKRAAAK